MYELMLTHNERMAIDWIGDRYGHGTDLYFALIGTKWKCEDGNYSDPWGDMGNIVFKIPEHIAWQIRDIGEEDDFLWTCFSPEFAQKMNDFCDKII
jgi:hypothetical protein